MANNIQSIRSALITKLQGVSGLVAVYGNEQPNEAGEYPIATVIYSGGEAQFGDTIRNIRTEKFVINIYQERTTIGFGNVKAENVILSICDEINTAFDADTTLSGLVKFVKPIRPNMDYVDRELGDTRVAQFIVEAVTVVPSTT